MFNDWLIKEKNFTTKAAHDTLSRVKRVQKLINRDSIPENALDLLESSVEFKGLSMCVKSQLRRASKLFLEYKQNN